MISGLPVEVIAKDVGTVFTGRDIVRTGRQTTLFTGFVMLYIADFRETGCTPLLTASLGYGLPIVGMAISITCCMTGLICALPIVTGARGW